MKIKINGQTGDDPAIGNVELTISQWRKLHAILMCNDGHYTREFTQNLAAAIEVAFDSQDEKKNNEPAANAPGILAVPAPMTQSNIFERIQVSRGKTDENQ